MCVRRAAGIYIEEAQLRKDEISQQIANCLHMAGIPFITQENGLRFDREREGMRWACGISFQEDYAHLFARLPFQIDPDGALPALNRLNIGLAEGCFLLREEGVLLRQTLLLPDAFAVKPALAAALPRQASFMIRARDALLKFKLP